MSNEWWFKTADDIRRCMWYICSECMVAGRNSTEAIDHKTACIHHKSTIQPLTRPTAETRDNW